MILEHIHLNEYYKLENDPVLEVFIPTGYDNEMQRTKKRGLIIAPGGAYMMTSKREAEPVAASFSSKGFQTFILWYTTTSNNPDVMYPAQILESMCAFDFVRKNADKYDVDEKSVAYMGFSAGGHLVASYGYECENESLKKLVGLSEKDLKPNALCLSYPVITTKDFTHKETKEIVTRNKPELVELLSCEDHVSPNYPKTYIWTTEEDKCVPPKNTYVMIEALKNAGVEYKSRIFPHGCHGLSLANEATAPDNSHILKDVSAWVDECSEFFKRVM